MAETQWLEYDEPTFEADIDFDISAEVDIDIPLAFDVPEIGDFVALPTVITLALGEDDPWPLEAYVRVVSVSDLA